MPVCKDEGGEEGVEQGEDQEERRSPDWKVEGKGFKVRQAQGEKERHCVRRGYRGERSPAKEESPKRGEADAGSSAFLPVEELAGAAQPVPKHWHRRRPAQLRAQGGH